MLTFHNLTKFDFIMFVDGIGARHEVGEGPDEEHQAGNRPRENGET